MPENITSVLIIYTGGTIGMVENSKTGSLEPFNFHHLLDKVPELRQLGFSISTVQFEPPIDSSEIEPDSWVKLVHIIADNYDLFDGFVVLHGTDTMAYSASALSFMLENLAKPVVFTGSQLPIGVPRTDGKENLISAVEIASAKDPEGHPRVPEVSIFFNSKLLRGNRSIKISSEDFSAFKSPNCPPLAEAGISIKYNDSVIRRPLDWDEHLRISTNLDTRVSILKVHPGITPQVMKYFLCGPDIRAAIIETYGSGNAPSRQWFLDIVKEASGMGKVLMNVTQCLSGTVNMDIYATGKALEKAGVVSGADITTESALAKLFYLMGKTTDNESVKSKLGDNLQGEISL